VLENAENLNISRRVRQNLVNREGQDTIIITRIACGNLMWFHVTDPQKCQPVNVQKCMGSRLPRSFLLFHRIFKCNFGKRKNSTCREKGLLGHWIY